MAGKPGAQVCDLCHGKRHGKPQCTSKGGGKWTDPSLNQKGKGAGSYGQQGKGKGKFGGKGWGRGKGKFNSFDDGSYAPPGFEPWQPQWSPDWSPGAAAAWQPNAAASAAQPSQPQFPWMAGAAATAAPPSDP